MNKPTTPPDGTEFDDDTIVSPPPHKTIPIACFTDEQLRRHDESISQAAAEAARRGVFDHIYDIAPKEQFMHWKPIDVSRFFQNLSEYERGLTQTNPEGGDK